MTQRRPGRDATTRLLLDGQVQADADRVEQCPHERERGVRVALPHDLARDGEEGEGRQAVDPDTTADPQHIRLDAPLPWAYGRSGHVGPFGSS